MLVDQDQFINRMGPGSSKVVQSQVQLTKVDQNQVQLTKVEQLQGYLEAELHQIYQSNYVAN